MNSAEEDSAERTRQLSIAEADDAETRARWYLMAAVTTTFGVAMLTILLRINWIMLAVCTVWLVVCAFNLGLRQDWLETVRRSPEKPRPARRYVRNEPTARKRGEPIFSGRKWESPLDEEARWRQNAKHGKFKAPGEAKEPPLR